MIATFSKVFSVIYGLYECADPLPHAHTKGGEATLGPSSVHCVNQRGEYSGSRATQGVAQGDGTTVHIDLGGIQAQFSNDPEGLSSEGLVQLY
jgi:hypothetical protein